MAAAAAADRTIIPAVTRLLLAILILAVLFPTPALQQSTKVPVETPDAVLLRVQTTIDGLPQCARDCFAKDPNYRYPMTLVSLRAVCANKTASASASSACSSAACSQPDFSATRSMLSQLPLVCYRLSSAEFPIAGAGASANVNNVKLPPGYSAPKSGAEGRGVARAAGVGGLVMMMSVLVLVW
ncbi:hypothetical protein HDU96_003739 [Phlyctochytrium bullatum]|nr:hypothetical protein HDU96_003739 [Phlyctochytrium bullatum]